MPKKYITIDGNEAAAYVAFRTNEVCSIYPITPSSNMGEWADQWAAYGKTNIWGTIPSVVEMQSEGGASGAIHGALQTGALATTFTASQGLLLMIPNMFKIAGELTSTVFHVSARAIAAQALSIFGDHSDINACRTTGWGMLGSASVQEVMDFALISQVATLKSRIPFIHFFDGFRTSHEVNKIEVIPDEIMLKMMEPQLIRAHRERALTPDKPVLRGSAQNPDVYFQGRETVNPFYDVCPKIVQDVMDDFAKLTGRQYRLFEYVGDPNAETVIVLMASGCETVHETVEYLTSKGEKVGVLKVRLYRPFSSEDMIKALPKSVKVITALDRTKEPGGAGEPLYQDILTALAENANEGWATFQNPIKVVGGRYGLASKEFTPAMVKSVFDNAMSAKPKNHFTIGIIDDVSMTSLTWDDNFSTDGDEVIKGVFFGLGADGTVSANKNSIKIIGEETENSAQGYFVYDSKKSGSITTSHLRFGPNKIRSTYLISQANFLGCHQTVFLETYDILKYAKPGAVFLLNTQVAADKVWDTLPRSVQESMIKKQVKFYIIDGYKVAKEAGLGGRINTIMQTCFFAISGILPRDEAIQRIKDSIKKTWAARGDKIVQMNFAAVDSTLANLFEVPLPATVTSSITARAAVAPGAPKYVEEVTSLMILARGDEVKVSQMPIDGTFELSTAQYEKRNIALEVPVWDTDTCIQCGKCVIACPHATIRQKVFPAELMKDAPATFKAVPFKGTEYKGMMYSLQVAVEDCTGCALCVSYCPAKNKSNTALKAINMADQLPLRDAERENWNFFLTLPEVDRKDAKITTVKGSQFLRPLFEFSGACAGCGETPYYKLLTQLYGDRAVIANATGCSSIYGGNLPTTPFAVDANGRGPAWSNSLFEDNAEFGFGFRLTFDKLRDLAILRIKGFAGILGDDLVDGIIQNVDCRDEAGIEAQRDRIKLMKEKLEKIDTDAAKDLLAIADNLVRRSVWIVGGDGWAYDIGYGGLDHVLASGRDVNIMVLDTEVYSNTGGQCSKATPIGAVAKFAAGGKPIGKKDLGLIAMTYGHVYVAQVAMGANDGQTIRAFLEADAYNGPSLIICYSHCIAHGIDMAKGMEHQQRAVNSGNWPMYRYNPMLVAEGKNPLKLDYNQPKIKMGEYMNAQTRFNMLNKSHPDAAKHLLIMAQQHAEAKWTYLEQLAKMTYGTPESN
ncbi:MAG: pyruvate:ferredoxin (flavodoxin) oxidoreductase [bacterium]|nr:pyruvate:ferredoxin (flavodoxin) oxidoreductase [bacterium]